VLCEFYPEWLEVRIPSRHPEIEISMWTIRTWNCSVRFRIWETKINGHVEKVSDYYTVKATYACLPDSPSPRAVRDFITYPDFEKGQYEIIEELNAEGKAETEFYPTGRTLIRGHW